MPRTSRRSSSAAHTPVVSSPSRARPPSPLSPTKVSRMEEKKEMQNLNDRLASYIDRVKQQEIEIGQLQQEVSTIEETKSSEVVTLRNAYSHEMGQLRKALDETCKEKAKLQIDADKYQKEATESKTKLREKERAHDAAVKEKNSLQSRVNRLQSDVDSAESELKTLRPENGKLVKKLEDAKKNLEDETLKRIDLQNQLQTSEESLRFENSMLEQQLNETRTRKQIEISEIDGKLHQQYEEKMQQSLAELRDTYEKQIAANRDEFTRVYDGKLKNLQSKLDETRQNSAGSVQEIRELETKVTGLTSRNLELESVNSTLQKRLADLIKQMEEESRNYRNDMAKKDAELKSKEEQMEEMLKDYHDLMDVKIALDTEILAYRKLIEQEEERLGMSPTSSPAATPAGRGVKRKRTTIVEEDITELVSEHEGRGNVIIEPLDKDGKFIKMTNRSGDELNIGGWTLTNMTGGEDTAYKFHRTTTLQNGETVTVYSSDTREEHEPPLSLVMKRGGWEIGDENVTTVKNKEGKEEAVRNSKKERSLSGSKRFGMSQLYSQDGEEADSKNCAIM